MIAVLITWRFPLNNWPDWLKNYIEVLTTVLSLFGLYQYAKAASESSKAEKARQEAQISYQQIEAIVNESNESLSKREKQLDNERKYHEFKQRLTHPDPIWIRFPDLPDHCNRYYFIHPIFDPTHQDPHGLQSDFDPGRPLFLVYIQGLGDPYIEGLGGKSKEWTFYQSCMHKHKEEYATAPIRTGEFAYCVFMNGDWHLSYDNSFFSIFRFEWKSYLPGGEINTATEYVEGDLKWVPNPVDGMTEVSTLLLNDGHPVEEGGGTQCVIYKDKHDHLFLVYGRSRPKKLYMQPADPAIGDSELVCHIDDFSGFVTGDVLARIKESVLAECRAKQVAVPVKKGPFHYGWPT
ncbi:hypothetical protein EBZ35_01000 [bacterium]|nr:hypothetical protein [bacterium]